MSYEHRNFEGRRVSLDRYIRLSGTERKVGYTHSSSEEYGDKRNLPSKRRRSPHFYFARAELRRILDGGHEYIDFTVLERHFLNWINESSSKYVRLKDDEGEEYLFIKQFRRFHEEYRRELRKKLRRLEVINWDLKIELTIDPKRFIWLYDEFVLITRAWHNLRRWIIKKYGRFVFIRILEFQKSGRPHLHVLIKGVSYIHQKKFAEVWVKYGGGPNVWITRILPNGRINAVRYVLKYVTKSFASNDTRYGVLLFASNKRLYSISNDLQRYLWRRN